jgi:predicted component of type VI protein secretion system
VEIWFGILSRKVLRGADFKNVTELRQAIEAFIATYNPKAKPLQVAQAGGEGIPVAKYYR